MSLISIGVLIMSLVIESIVVQANESIGYQTLSQSKSNFDQQGGLKTRHRLKLQQQRFRLNEIRQHLKHQILLEV